MRVFGVGGAKESGTTSTMIDASESFLRARVDSNCLKLSACIDSNHRPFADEVGKNYTQFTIVFVIGTNLTWASQAIQRCVGVVEVHASSEMSRIFRLLQQVKFTVGESTITP